MAMVLGRRRRAWTIWDGDGHITMMIPKSPQGDTCKDPQDGRKLILVDSDKVGENNEMLGQKEAERKMATDSQRWWSLDTYDQIEDWGMELGSQI